MTLASDIELQPERLSAGDGPPIFVADFQAYSSAPRLSQLMASQGSRNPIFRVDPVTDLARDGFDHITLPVLARAYADGFLSTGINPAAAVVVGYCSAGALALHVAGRLASQGDVPVVLVRPTWPDTAMIIARFAKFQSDLGVTERFIPRFGEDPLTTIREVAQVLHGNMLSWAVRVGLDQSSPELHELLARCRAWLSFLLATRNALETSWASEVRLDVLATTRGESIVPGRPAETYQTTRLPFPEREPVITAELSRFVLKRVEALAPLGEIR
jgi:hypothetical protein